MYTNIAVQTVNLVGRSKKSAVIARYNHTPTGELYMNYTHKRIAIVIKYTCSDIILYRCHGNGVYIVIHIDESIYIPISVTTVTEVATEGNAGEVLIQY